MRIRWGVSGLVVVLAVVALGACSKKVPPVARPVAPPPPAESPVTPAKPPAPPEPVGEKPIQPEPMTEDTMASRSLDELNRDSPLRPVFFGLDSAEVTPEGQKVLEANAGVLKKYPNWVITVEGHCDERGTAEYNLALGERRAVAAKTYLVSLGVPADRVKVVSYGKEFPFDPGKTEEAYARNRRGHFVITAK